MNTKRALVCSFYTPQPDRDSGSRSILDFIDFLREAGWKVTFVRLHDFDDERYIRALQQRGITIYDHDSTQIDQLLAAVHFELALLVSWPIAELYLPIIRQVSPATRVFVASLDLHFLRDARRILGQAKDGASDLLDGKYAYQLIGELNTYAAADGVLAVSKKEADLLNDLVGGAELAHVASDAEDLSPSTIPFAKRRGIVFVGCFRHAPNLQALEYLRNEVLPRIDPTIMLEHPIYIVGDGLNHTALSYENELPGVRLVGWVPSVAPYFHRARISVIPLQYGAGTKRKMIQTLMAGTPSVSTTVGTEGLNLRDEEHVLVADDPATFARSIMRLLEDKSLWQRIARNGYAQISETYSREAAQERFRQALSAVLAKEAKPLMFESSRELYQERAMYQYYQQLVPHIRQVVHNEVPHGSTVLVVSKGDDHLLKLDGVQAWHFPQTEDGAYAGYYPADSSAAIDHLEELRMKGGDYLVFPRTAFWWLDHYGELREHLERHYRVVARQEDVCLIYALREPTLEQYAPEVTLQRDEEGARVGDEPSTSNIIPSQTTVESSTPAIAEPVERTDRIRGNGSSRRPENVGGARLIAFYLPQFHPIPENEAWWGEGFTDWTNVAKSRPLFPEHYQPHLPADLGFYDLRLPEARQKQADLAKEYGIHGFCYYHYWFNGKRLLDRPFSEVLDSGKPDFPFCLCWANEPWTRRWDGHPHEILQPQKYSDEDDVAHILWLMPALRDPRAIKVEGKPLFLVYRAQELPDPARTTETWRREVLNAGLEGIYLIAVETGWYRDPGWDATQEGFDARVLFMPQFTTLATMPRIPIFGKESLQVYDYQQAWPILANPDPVPYRRYDTVFPSWDSSPRKGDSAIVLHNSTPEAYEQWLSHAITRAQEEAADHRVVFINAWNEWAEGAHLEPDIRHGHAYLEATRRALLSQQPRGSSLRMRK